MILFTNIVPNSVSAQKSFGPSEHLDVGVYREIWQQFKLVLLLPLLSAVI